MPCLLCCLNFPLPNMSVGYWVGEGNDTWIKVRLLSRHNFDKWLKFSHFQFHTETCLETHWLHDLISDFSSFETYLWCANMLRPMWMRKSIQNSFRRGFVCRWQASPWTWLQYRSRSPCAHACAQLYATLLRDSWWQQLELVQNLHSEVTAGWKILQFKDYTNFSIIIIWIMIFLF